MPGLLVQRSDAKGTVFHLTTTPLPSLSIPRRPSLWKALIRATSSHTQLQTPTFTYNLHYHAIAANCIISHRAPSPPALTLDAHSRLLRHLHNLLQNQNHTPPQENTDNQSPANTNQRPHSPSKSAAPAQLSPAVTQHQFQALLQADAAVGSQVSWKGATTNLQHTPSPPQPSASEHAPTCSPPTPTPARPQPRPPSPTRATPTQPHQSTSVADAAQGSSRPTSCFQ